MDSAAASLAIEEAASEAGAASLVSAVDVLPHAASEKSIVPANKVEINNFTFFIQSFSLSAYAYLVYEHPIKKRDIANGLFRPSSYNKPHQFSRTYRLQ